MAMKYHILAIAGTMTTPIALELVRLGHQVTGSDQEKIYPPISDLLSNIPLNLPFPQADLYIVGSSYKNFAICQQEFDEIKKNNLPYISATEFLSQFVIKPESVLIAGSYGKSTISSFLSWLFLKLNLNPSYYFGGIANFPSLAISNTQFSIVEADESINGLDTKAKFLYYPVKYLILTSTNWEHKDSYKSNQENLNAYKQLIENLPSDGILVYNQSDSDISSLLPFSKAKNIPYQNFDFKTVLIGKHNQENINAALTLCQALNFDMNRILTLIPQFSGIKRRLEIINENPLIIDDFAQSPARIQSAINSVAQTFPNRPIKIFFEPHASFLSYKSSLEGISQAFSLASEIVISKIKFDQKISKDQRTTYANYSKELSTKSIYLPLAENIIQHYKNTLNKNDILIHFSSGGLNGLNTLNQIVYNISNQ